MDSELSSCETRLGVEFEDNNSLNLSSVLDYKANDLNESIALNISKSELEATQSLFTNNSANYNVRNPTTSENDCLIRQGEHSSSTLASSYKINEHLERSAFSPCSSEGNLASCSFEKRSPRGQRKAFPFSEAVRRGRCRHQRKLITPESSDYRRSEYDSSFSDKFQEVADRLCSEIDRIAEDLRRTVRREVRELALHGPCYNEGNNSASSQVCPLTPISEVSDLSQQNALNNSASCSKQFVSCCCGVGRNESSHHVELSHDVGHHTSVLRRAKNVPMKSEQCHTCGAKIRKARDNPQTDESSLRKSMDEKYSRLRQLWSKPTENCIEIDGNVFVNLNSP